MARRVSRWKFQGIIRTRKILRGLPEAFRSEMVEELTAVGAYGAKLMKNAAPMGRTGQLRNAITFKLSAKQLVLRVGIIGKRLARSVFYAKILEFGRKAQVVQARRRTGTAYAMRISAIPADRYDFIFGAPRREVRDRAIKGLRATYTRALRAVSARASDG